MYYRCPREPLLVLQRLLLAIGKQLSLTPKERVVSELTCHAASVVNSTQPDTLEALLVV